MKNLFHIAQRSLIIGFVMFILSLMLLRDPFNTIFGGVALLFFLLFLFLGMIEKLIAVIQGLALVILFVLWHMFFMAYGTVILAKCGISLTSPVLGTSFHILLLVLAPFALLIFPKGEVENKKALVFFGIPLCWLIFGLCHWLLAAV